MGDNSISLEQQFREPLVRESELNENSTHYDKLIAAPSNDEMLSMWIAWSSVIYVMAIFTTTVLVALLCNRMVRQRPFNMFLIYLMIPDTLVLWLCASSCLVNAVNGAFTSVGHCRFQSFYITVAIGANAWLNAIITRHLLVMLRSAKQFRKYKPPSRQRVTIEALAVYVYNLAIATCFMFDESTWWPFKTRLSTGVVCIPQDYDTTSTIVFYLIFFPLWFGGPLVYVCYTTLLIWKQQLMPKSGRRRILALYFFRLVLAFLVMWIPCLVLMFVSSPWTDPWVVWAGGFWGHLQGAVSGVMSLMKPDIWDAFCEFYSTCRCRCFDNNNKDPSSRRNHSEWDAESFNSTIFFAPSSLKTTVSSLFNFGSVFYSGTSSRRLAGGTKVKLPSLASEISRLKSELDAESGHQRNDDNPADAATTDSTAVPTELGCLQGSSAMISDIMEEKEEEDMSLGVSSLQGSSSRRTGVASRRMGVSCQRHHDASSSSRRRTTTTSTEEEEEEEDSRRPPTRKRNEEEEPTQDSFSQSVFHDEQSEQHIQQRPVSSCHHHEEEGQQEEEKTEIEPDIP